MLEADAAAERLYRELLAGIDSPSEDQKFDAEVRAEIAVDRLGVGATVEDARASEGDQPQPQRRAARTTQRRAARTTARRARDPVNPSRILDLASAFWSSAALLAAVEHDLFAHLEGPGATATSVAAAAGLPERSTAMLLDAVTALGLCAKDGEHYRNHPEASAFLVAGRPGSLAGALGYNAALFPAWARLADAVRCDAPIVETATYTGDDPARTRAFVEGMHQRALGMGHSLVGSLDLTGRHHLLDVAGGPGTLSVLLARRHPVLHATVLDLPGIAAVGRDLVAAQGLGDRVIHRDADVFTDDLGADYDAVLVSGLLHREPPAACQALLGRLHQALLPGGAIYLVDVMRDATRVGPPFAALFGLNMLLTSERGGCHADVDHVAWLAAAGFTDPAITRPTQYVRALTLSAAPMRQAAPPGNPRPSPTDPKPRS